MPKSYTDEAMSAAITDVKNNQLSIRESSKKYNVPKSSLSDRLMGKVQAGSKWGRRPLFSDQDEKEMIKCATDRAQWGIGFKDSTANSKNRVLECTSREALEVIESTLSSDKKLRFQAALISGVNTKIDNDPLYQSWKHYTMLVHGSFPRSNVTKQSSVPATSSSNTAVPVQHEENLLYSSQSVSIPSAHTVASQVFPMPKPTNKKRIANSEYFVMTADEIIKEKRMAFDIKKKELEVKQMKREERNKKKIEKALKKSDKSYKKNVKATEISITEML
ncbi:hypothetical protein KUTeg_012250 [Tegillarca granosa]|uniref:HTH psq-type domain-containing protein n=1 Tax=Tegillarca granosa TaxID=220873 RepID=A0ABQ9EYZ9_TEGGR|nr:hypothetical protein KUTeg_012250 [Tegillarca granosa]